MNLPKKFNEHVNSGKKIVSKKNSKLDLSETDDFWEDCGK